MKNKEQATAELINGIDYKLLRAQKVVLEAMIASDRLPDAEYGAITGMIALIDNIQDIAVDVYGKPEQDVFNLQDEEGTPIVSLKEANEIAIG